MNFYGWSSHQTDRCCIIKGNMSNSASQYADCRDLFAALSRYLDKDLPPADCAAIEAHIADCAPCVEFVNSLKKTVELCRTSGTPAEPQPMAEEVRKQLLKAYQQSLVVQKPGH
jgi:anti-sigma factor RsiW